jgi:hypothetical protein
VLLDLDTTAQVAGVPDSNFTSPRQLGEVLARTPQCQDCIVKQAFRYIAGRPDGAADRAIIHLASDAFRESDFNFKKMLVTLIRARQESFERKQIDVAVNH